MQTRFTFVAERQVTLNEFLRESLVEKIGSQKELSNSKVRRLIACGNVHVGGRQCRIPSFVLRSGNSVTVFFDEEKFFFEKKARDIDFTLCEKDVLFEDVHIIVVNKPAFIPTEKTIVSSRENMHECVVDYLWKKNPSLRNPPYAGIMHRLDHETSGALLFTKSREVNKAVHELFESHSVQKTYRAVSCVTSRLSERARGESFSVQGMMDRISPKSAPCKMALSGEKGLYSHTDFKVLGERNGLCFLECMPTTGRTHQIRVHCASVGLPLLGDALYGGKPCPDEWGGRIMLHARRLCFLHPVSGERMVIEAPLPFGFEPLDKV